VSFTPCVRCRSCGGRTLLPVLDLGEQPLANAYPAVDATDAEARYPLAIVSCIDCSLVQLTGTVDPRVMFEDYPYFSSYSDTMVAAMEHLSKRLTERFSLGTDDLVVEVASNDGYLLRHYRASGIPVLGVEPAANVARAAEEVGVPTVIEYFSKELGRQLAGSGRMASVLHANNVMAHVPAINDFVAGVAAVLRPAGTAVIETPYLVQLISDCEFDTIYHEHVFYYSLTAIDALMRRHALAVVDVERLAIHGGSLRVYVQHESAAVASDGVLSLLEDERRLGVATAEYYEDFSVRVEEIKQRTRELLAAEKANGGRIAAYGAAAKGTVLLNHFGIDTSVVDFVVDRSPHKQGRRMPGVGIPVRQTSALLEEQPDLVLMLAWNLADEILEQQAPYRDAGGRFLLPIPLPRVL
jgi:SAM-dependent methyltransferase